MILFASRYPVPPRAETIGRTEVYIGNWMKARGCRDKVFPPWSSDAWKGGWLLSLRCCGTEGQPAGFLSPPSYICNSPSVIVVCLCLFAAADILSYGRI